MGILSSVPDLLDAAEKACSGHGAELLKAMDTVATASFFLGVVVGAVGMLSAIWVYVNK